MSGHSVFTVNYGALDKIVTMYKDRIEAGTLLSRRLEQYRKTPGIILAVPRGGVPVGYAIAKELDLPMEIIYAKKIGHPANKEYAIGAVSLNGSFIEPHPEVSDAYVKQEIARIRKNLLLQQHKLSGDMPSSQLTGKTIILVDDGMATGNTLLGTIHILKKNHPARIILAVPVAPQSAIDHVSDQVSEVVCPLVPKEFESVGAFYKNFNQVTDEDVVYYLEKLKRPL